MDKQFVLSLMSDKMSKRSRQKAVGPSEIGGCEAKVWHRLNGTARTNFDTSVMASWMGTAIHAALERRLEDTDPFQERYLREVEVEHNGLMGHVDVYDKSEREVIDWKTITKKKVAAFPSAQQWTQVQLYGYLLSANGYDVETVTLVGIPRDGNEQDIVIASQPYDPLAAAEALEWLAGVQRLSEPPEPGMSKFFCRNYCGFYDASGETGCVGGA